MREVSINYRSVICQSLINSDGAYFWLVILGERKDQAKRGSYRELCLKEARARVMLYRGGHPLTAPTIFMLAMPPLDPLCYAPEVVTVISGCRRYFQAFASSRASKPHPVSGSVKRSREKGTSCTVLLSIHYSTWIRGESWYTYINKLTKIKILNYYK